MELNFEKQGTKWVAEFEVTGDFNLHIEREEKGFLFVQQRTTPDGEYDSVNGANFSPSDGVIDMDFVALVYPKYIKVVSEAEVTRAVVLPEGVAKPNIKLIEFYVVGTPYQAEEGMTWQQFIESEYNNGDFSIAYGGPRYDGMTFDLNGTPTQLTDIIVNGADYGIAPL